MATSTRQYQFPNGGRFTRQDLTAQNGAADEVAIDSVFGTPSLVYVFRVNRNVLLRM